MQPELQRLEVQRFAPSDHDLSVEHALPGKLSQQRRDQVRVVPRKWLRVPALQVDLALVTKDEHAETIPLGLEDPVATRRKRSSTRLASIGRIGRWTTRATTGDT